MPEHAAPRGTAGGFLVGRVQGVKLSYCAAADEDSARVYNTLRGDVRRGAKLIALANLGCKTYLKMPKDYHRKDLRDKAFTGYFIGYNELGAIGDQVYVPDLKKTVVGVHCTFNEVVPSYREKSITTS